MAMVIFKLPNGKQCVFEAAEGKTLLQVAQDNKLDVEGACGGVMACSTCHMIVDPVWIVKLGNSTEEEDEMLDITWGVKENSRLGCQITVTEKLDGLVVSLPLETENLFDG
jgi:2Fe-2S ferredoxin